MEAAAPLKEASELIRDAGGEAFRLCFQCGLCTVSCPWNNVTTFMPHKMISQARFGLAEIDDEAWWLCTTCNMCVGRCPREVAITDIMRAVRSIVMEYQYSMVQSSLRNAFGSLSGEGNPWGGERERRADWIEGLDVKILSGNEEILYFPCCVPAYDARLGGVARATARILQETGADFGILGTRENCCGESVRKAGNEGVFEILARGNIDVFRESGVTEIIVSSPHCYTTFRREYPGLGGEFRVLHITQYLAELLDRGGLGFTKEFHKRVVYHDPCYLGRHNGIYEEPRRVLSSIPGLECMDEINARENSLCCGGGGGRIWMETKKGERFSDILVEQALELGADILATACPYCILNLKDSVATMDLEGVLEIRDISEIVQEVI